MLKQLIMGIIGTVTIVVSTQSFATTQWDSSTIIAREANEGSRGSDRTHIGTHKNKVDTESVFITREAGSQQRGRGRNGLTEDDSNMVLAREASEPPRGRDNERPGDRQRRGGRA